MSSAQEGPPPPSITPSTEYLNDLTTVQYPYPNGRTYIFYWNTSGVLSFYVGNKIQGGSNSYSVNSITVNSVSISNNSNNAPLASALTSDGNIHLFYSDNKANRTLTEVIFNPNSSAWSIGTLTTLGLKVHLQSGISAWSEPVLKVVIQSTTDSEKITEAWWDSSSTTWKSLVIS